MKVNIDTLDFFFFLMKNVLWERNLENEKASHGLGEDLHKTHLIKGLYLKYI